MIKLVLVICEFLKLLIKNDQIITLYLVVLLSFFTVLFSTMIRNYLVTFSFPKITLCQPKIFHIPHQTLQTLTNVLLNVIVIKTVRTYQKEITVVSRTYIYISRQSCLPQSTRHFIYLKYVILIKKLHQEIVCT